MNIQHYKGAHPIRALILALLTAASVGGSPAIAATPRFVNPFNPFGLVGVGFGAAPTFGDLDGDGDLDALVGNSVDFIGGADFTFYENVGTATAAAFASGVSNPFGLSSSFDGVSPTLVDLDADGDLDVMIGDATGHCAFYENVGTPTAPAFTAYVADPFGLVPIGELTSPTFADIDGDGDLDAFVGTIRVPPYDSLIGSTIFFENTGTAHAPAFAAPQIDPFGLTDVATLASPELVDIDGDGDLDAVIGDGSGNSTFFMNVGTANAPAFSGPQPNPFGLTQVIGSAEPVFVDIDGDGDKDAFLGETNGVIVFSENVGTASAAAFQPLIVSPFDGIDSEPNIPPVSQFTNKSPAFADIDGDGDLDLFIGDLYGRVAFYENLGSPIAAVFSPSQFVLGPFGLGEASFNAAGGPNSSVSLTFGDLDGDGDLDCVLGHLSGDLHFSENIGTPTAPTFGIPQVNPFGLSNVGPTSAPVLADLDGDGDLDLLVGTESGGSFWLQNIGTVLAPAFAPPVADPFGIVPLPTSLARPALADLDGDGDSDVLVGDFTGHLTFFENTGTAVAPAFAAPRSEPFHLDRIGFGSHPALGDLDHDGDTDVLVGQHAGPLAFFEQRYPIAILGKKLSIADPRAGTDDVARVVVVELRDAACDRLLVGNPTDAGAVLQVSAETVTGVNGSQNECFNLDASGWRRVPLFPALPLKGYEYLTRYDLTLGPGLNPVSSVRFERAGGKCRLRATLKGRKARNALEPLPVAPPGAVTVAGVRLRLHDSLEEWCGGFGIDTNPINDPDPRGSIKEVSVDGVPTLLRMERPSERGCPFAENVCR